LETSPLETSMDNHLHDRGLTFDLTTLLGRRRLLGLLAGAGLTLIGCSSTTTSGTGGTGTAATTTAGATTGQGSGAGCEKIPQETGGPFPADGSNGPNVLTESGIVRSDIRASFGTASGVASGVPLTINLTLLDSNGCSPLPGAAVYLWQCDANGSYSLYSQGAANQNYLRGVQQADNAGNLSFQSIFPAAYSGRWPHIHFEVFRDLATATSAGAKLITSQMALPEDVCREVYATDGYSTSLRNMARTSLQDDNVFRDGYQNQLASISGSVSGGLVANLAVAV
jgi:protocatechuate 3,4-dioxygenase beta subunit